MEELASEQDQTGFEIERLITNYRKDGPTRRTVSYLNRRLTELNELWASFCARDEQLQEYATASANHPYFANNYFTVMQREYMTARDAITGLLKEAQKEELPAKVTTPNPSVNKPGASVELTQPITPPMKVQHGENDIGGLRYQLDAIISSINFMIDGIYKAPLKNKSYCELKISTLTKYWDELRDVHRTICRSQGDKATYSTVDYNQTEERIQDALIFLSTNKDKAEPGQHGLVNPQSYIKLPEMSIPKFDGNYGQWTSFHDLFHQIIDSQPLGNAQKMWYLKANLMGEPERLIKHMPVSDENYKDAWTILRSRYDNKRLMVTTFLEKLLSQPTIVADSAASIKQCHDTTKECMLGLRNIKVDTTNWDPILIHLLLKRLDKTSHNLYEQSLKCPRELQSLDSFLTFLELRFQALEAFGNEKRSGIKNEPKKLSALVSTNQTSASGCKNCNGNHKIYACEQFKKLTIPDRIKRASKLKLCMNCLRAGHRSSECSSRACMKCNKRHNTLLHKPESTTSTPSPYTTSGQPQQAELKPQAAEFEPKERISLATEDTRAEVLLSTVMVQTTDNRGKTVDLRAILDSGSQVNLITEAALKKLNRKSQAASIAISSVGGVIQKATRQIKLPIQSKQTNYKIQVDAYVVRQITTYQPSETFSREDWPIPGNISLADPSFNQAGPVKMQIGVEWYYQLLSIGQIKMGEFLPTLQNTLFGWIVGGRFSTPKIPTASPKIATCGMYRTEGQRLDAELEKFWKLEEGEKPTTMMTSKERQCEAHFYQNVKRDDNGRFIVRLPFVLDPKQLGQSKDMALKRFIQLEKRLAKDPEVKRAYQEFMEEYLKLGHMEEINMPNSSEPHFVLPHHCVLRPDSSTTKLRVVFDASAKTTTNTSLNDVLHTGPTIQDELFTILLRFRLFKYVFSADIEKIYRQIQIDKRDRAFQIIFWRNHPSEALRCYQLNTVTYGTTVAPYLATKCLEQLAVNSKIKHPLGSLAVQKDFYMDDLLTGANNLQDALQKKEEVQQILRTAGFKLQKWCANHSDLIKDINPLDREVQYTVTDSSTEHVKTLGVIWLPKQDELVIRVPTYENPAKVTKRTALSTIAHIFDPLGLMSPVTVTAKIFIQNLWKLKLDWDAALPMELHSTWINFRQSLAELNEIRIPRHVFGARVPRSTQLHAFSDASEKAYGAAVYFRANHYDGTITVHLLCAKTRVAPIKTITIPRLELCAAKLAVEVVHRLQSDLELPGQSCYFWTDSEVVLHWIHSEAASYQTFVANRIAAIQQYSTPNQWRHVKSSCNPADLASRGTVPAKLKESPLWFYGPLFLHGHPDMWPAKPAEKEINLEKKKAKRILVVTEAEPHFIHRINHGNSFRKLKCIVALVIRFTRVISCKVNSRRKTNPPTVSELEAASSIIIREIQQQEFSEEIKTLEATNQLSVSNRLSSLTPFLDSQGLLRVGGRLELSDLEYNHKHPVLLPYAHPITKLILNQIHKDHQHAGPQALLAIARQRYWPIKGKTLARSVVQNCVTCARAKPKLLTQLMGDLPANRVHQARPFVNTGVDFAGPFYTHFKGRGKQPHKSYLAVFCCFATKAVHFELATELTTEAFMGALKRFVSRRGNCRNIYCDNATNFVGANNQLTELKQRILDKQSQESIIKFCTARGTDFHFIPPRAPHFGGLWEAAVKSAKHLIVKNLANVNLTYEELETVVIEAEAILNSRPLTPLSSDPNDLQALTPGHFLIGEPLTSSVDVNAEIPRLSLGHRWKLVMDLKYKLWQRWSNEYLNELQHRHKWKQQCNNITPGMMVILKEENTPVLKWPLGRIVNIFKGNDGLVRVADVKTSSGILRRPIHKLAPLPVNDQPLLEEEGFHEPPTQTTEAHNNNSETCSKKNKSTDKAKAGPSGTKRRRLGNLVLQSLLLVGLFIPGWATAVTTHPFETSPGVYVENLGPAHLILNEWKLLVYYDLTSYWKELDTIKLGINQLQFLNQLLNTDATCQGIISQFQSLVREADKINALMQHRTKEKVRRTKRGAFNIVGNIASSLFGVLDSEYAEHMSNVINRLEDSDQHLQELIRNQTLVINSTVNIMTESNRLNEQRLSELREAINTNIQQENNMTHEIRKQKTFQSFTLLATRLTLTLNNYQRTQAALWDSFIDTNHGKLNSLLLTPDQLQSAIASIREGLPNTVRLPISSGDLADFYRIITIHGCSLHKKMMFLLKIPLVSYDQYETMHLVPVPLMMNGTISEIELRVDFLIINLHRDTYYPITERELKSCRVVSEHGYMCNQVRPLYRRGSPVAACELSFLNHFAWPNKCHLKPVAEPRRWIPLIDSNHWIYFMIAASTINIDCGKEISSITLNGTGILEIPEDCSIKEESLTIQAHKLFSSSYKTHFVSTRNLSTLSFTSDEPILSPIQAPNVSKENHLHELQQRITTLLESELPSTRNESQEVHHFVVGYMGLVIGSCLLAYLLWNKLFHRYKKPETPSSTLAPIPAPRSTPGEAFSLRLKS